jgi:hypothetical protein
MLASRDDQHHSPDPIYDAREIALLEMRVVAPLDEPEHVGQKDYDNDPHTYELPDRR